MPRNAFGRSTPLLAGSSLLGDKSKGKAKSGNKPDPIRETITYPKVTLSELNDSCLLSSLTLYHLLSCGHQVCTALQDEPCAPNCYHVKKEHDRHGLSSQHTNAVNGKRVSNEKFRCDACVEETFEKIIPSSYDSTEAEDYRTKLRAEARKSQKSSNDRKCYIFAKNSSVPVTEDGKPLPGYVPAKNRHPHDSVWPHLGWGSFEDLDVEPDQYEQETEETVKTTTEVTDLTLEDPPSDTESEAGPSTVQNDRRITQSSATEITDLTLDDPPSDDDDTESTSARTQDDRRNATVTARTRALPNTVIASSNGNPKKRKNEDEEAASCAPATKKNKSSAIKPALPATAANKQKTTKAKPSLKKKGTTTESTSKKTKTNVESSLPVQASKSKKSTEVDGPPTKQSSGQEKRKAAVPVSIAQGMKTRKNANTKASQPTPAPITVLPPLYTKSSKKRKNTDDDAAPAMQSSKKRKSTIAEPASRVKGTKKRTSTSTTTSEESVVVTRSAAKKQTATFVALPSSAQKKTTKKNNIEEEDDDDDEDEIAPPATRRLRSASRKHMD
jgi:hypothetical protein